MNVNIPFPLLVVNKIKVLPNLSIHCICSTVEYQFSQEPEWKNENEIFQECLSAEGRFGFLRNSRLWYAPISHNFQFLWKKIFLFSGAMPLMANLLLSTGRPIINHPHYEDVGLRERTKRVYEMYSRKPVEQVHHTMMELKANYLLLSKSYCLNGNMWVYTIHQRFTLTITNSL